jgi:hypothetical protein
VDIGARGKECVDEVDIALLCRHVEGRQTTLQWAGGEAKGEGGGVERGGWACWSREWQLELCVDAEVGMGDRALVARVGGM